MLNYKHPWVKMKNEEIENLLKQKKMRLNTFKYCNFLLFYKII